MRRAEFAHLAISCSFFIPENVNPRALRYAFSALQVHLARGGSAEGAGGSAPLGAGVAGAAVAIVLIVCIQKLLCICSTLCSCIELFDIKCIFCSGLIDACSKFKQC